MLTTTVLNAYSQAVPAPASPAQLPGGISRPGQLPGTMQPNSQGTGPRGLPGAQQQGTRSQPGAQQQGTRSQSQQGTGTTTTTTTQSNQQGGRSQVGQTTTQQSSEGNANGDATDNSVVNERQRNNVDGDPLFDDDSYEAIRRRELLAQRRKLFGYELFNNPNFQTTFQPNLRIATPAGYVLGPDDELNINVYGRSEMDYNLTVNPDGFVVIPRIGPVQVAGSTIETAKARLRDRMSKIYVGLKNSAYGPANTFMTVTLGDIRSIRVTVLGEAVKPGTYTLSSLSTALNAIYDAGGPNEVGSYRAVQLIRNNRVAATLDLYDFLTMGVQRNNLRLQDNDVLRFTTFKSHVEITGPVRRNNIFELLPGENMQRLIDLAGGFSSNAYRSRLKVTRFTDKELKVLDVTEEDYKTFTLQDGDNVAVEQLLDRYENQVSITGAVFRPGNYSLNQNKTLRQLIKSAEGLRGDAFTGRISLVRTREDMAVENISLNMANIINGVDPDVELQREDQVVIPSKFEMTELAFIRITGEVNIPIQEVPYTANMTLEDLLIKAGGLKEAAAASQIEVARRKKDVDPTSTTAQIAEIYRIDVGRDLSLKQGATPFYLEPFDQVIVRRSPNYMEQTFATIEGEVITPGAYPIRSKDQRVSDLIKLSGGLTPYAYVEGATLLRTVTLSQQEASMRQQTINELANDSQRATVNVVTRDSAQQEPIGISLKRIMERPGSSEDMLLQEGDVLRVPKRLETVSVGGEVLLPTTVKFRNNQTFQDYISQAGGFTSRSARKRAYVVYANGSADRTRKFAFFNIYPRVEPGASIVIPQKATNELTARQVLSEATGIASSVMALLTTVLLFRTLR
ncbi:polysaccharide biosynthesis/export family protein [Tellurirhabdus bombi]|uniref:polysaccharide biosynthesis/export family protein n=1 Tax=Tellurirhabdus bombi TaxID=2907205 RepID=UPI001F18A710|nr:SLBB domain-containing protein [Tellurirhabdus bombi]